MEVVLKRALYWFLCLFLISIVSVAFAQESIHGTYTAINTHCTDGSQPIRLPQYFEIEFKGKSVLQRFKIGRCKFESYARAKWNGDNLKIGRGRYLSNTCGVYETLPYSVKIQRIDNDLYMYDYRGRDGQVACANGILVRSFKKKGLNVISALNKSEKLSDMYTRFLQTLSGANFQKSESRF